MKKTTFLVCFICISYYLQSQNINSTNTAFHYTRSVNLELGGYGLITSALFEDVFINKEKYKTAVILGVGYYGAPLGIHQIFSFNNHHIEIGVAYISSISAWSIEKFDPYLTGRIGYRFQRPDGRFTFKAGIMPIILGNDRELGADMYLWIWPGISFGLTF